MEEFRIDPSVQKKIERPARKKGGGVCGLNITAPTLIYRVCSQLRGKSPIGRISPGRVLKNSQYTVYQSTAGHGWDSLVTGCIVC